MLVQKPNFFIIGAPKCGTTALTNYLRTHPNVFISKVKEINFFSLPYDGRKDFPVFNSNKILCRSMTAYIASRLKQLYRFLRIKLNRTIFLNNPIVDLLRSFFLKFYRKHCVEVSKRETPSEVFIQELKNYFYGDVMLLAKLLNRDLSDWLT